MTEDRKLPGVGTSFRITAPPAPPLLSFAYRLQYDVELLGTDRETRRARLLVLGPRQRSPVALISISLDELDGLVWTANDNGADATPNN